MFRGLDCKDPIVVPSCDEHNTAKGKRDSAIVRSLLKTLEQQETHHRSGPEPLTENIAKAIKIAKDRFHESRRLVTLHPVLEDPPDGWDNSWARLAPQVRIGEWIRQLTAAVAWSAIGYFEAETKWNQAILRTNSFFRADTPLNKEYLVRYSIQWDRDEAVLNRYAWYPGWNNEPGEYPRDIYRFGISFLPPQWQQEGNTLFRHTFYDCLVWYVWIIASRKTQEALRAMADP